MNKVITLKIPKAFFLLRVFRTKHYNIYIFIIPSPSSSQAKFVKFKNVILIIEIGIGNMVISFNLQNYDKMCIDFLQTDYCKIIV